MTATTIPETTTADTPEVSRELEMIRARAARGLALYEARGDEIARVSEDVYTVPGSKGRVYTVDYGTAEGEGESCDCPDYLNRGAEAGIPCKHIFAVGIARSKRRGGETREGRTPATCSGCDRTAGEYPTGRVVLMGTRGNMRCLDCEASIATALPSALVAL